MARTLVRPPHDSGTSVTWSTLVVALAEAPDLVRIADAQGTAVFVSDAASDLVGHRPDELVGLPVGVVDHPDDRSTMAYVRAEAARTGEPIRRIHRLVNAEGDARWVETTARSVVDDGRDFTMFISRDASVLQELTRSGPLTRERLATVVGAVPYPVVLVDEEGLIIAATDAWAALMVHPGHVVGAPIDALCRWRFGAGAAHRLRQVLSRTVHRQMHQGVLLPTSSSQGRVWVSCTPVTAPLVGGVEEVVLVFQSDGNTEATVDDDAVQRARHLTSRERDVLLSLAEGLSTRGVAQRLGICESTVRGHTKAVLHKLQVHTQLQAVLVGVRAGIVPLAANSS